MYNVHVPFGFLWSIDGSFDRRRWPPRAQGATAVDEESFRFELTSLIDENPVLKMHWVVVMDPNGGFSLRAEWNSLE
jgi:hypothetical protein